MKEAIIKTGRWIMEKNLTWGTSGNISVRFNDKIYITASGTVIGDLKEDDIIICDLSGKILEGNKKPSKETGMHLEVYKARPDVHAIVHTSPFYSTMCACSEIELKPHLFIESMYYNNTVAVIPYHHAGSIQLAASVREACEQTSVILMKNHGVLVYDQDLAECQSALEITENVCKMNILANLGNIRLQEVAPEIVDDFLSGNYYKKRRD
ncbi:class II aldolase/adducin family protein [Lacrimispora sp.]|uniref:class II aldolase/adducin family protein n=1 Tax=Lacrimispora sp. TaxID=2719234 RepID=UPI00345F161B